MVQGALVEVLEGQGIDDIAVCANAPEAASRVVGELLASAVEAAQAARAARRAAPDAADIPAPASGAPPVPQWAEDADPNHVAASGLPDIAEELKGRMKVRRGVAVVILFHVMLCFGTDACAACVCLGLPCRR